jgi:hypothetical protein
MGDILPFTGVRRSYDAPAAPALVQSDPGDENDAGAHLRGATKMVVIGLCGLKGSGKSTAAQHLADEHGFRRSRFAGPLKTMLRALLDEMGIGHHQSWHLIEGEHKETPTPLFAGKSPREAMVTLGTEWGRDLIGPDFWVSCWRHSVERLRIDHVAETCGMGEFRIVAEDCRFPNEAAAIRALGGKLIWIDRPGLVAADHPSERSLTAADCDHVIANDGAMLDLTQALDRLLASI